MRKFQYTGLLLLTAMTFSLTACGLASSKDTSASASETASAAGAESTSDRENAGTESVDTENAAYYDQAAGLVVKKFEPAFEAYKGTVSVGADALDESNTVFVGSIYCLSPEQTEDIQGCVFVNFYYGADPDMTEEEIAVFYNNLMKQYELSEEYNWENMKLEKRTVPSGRTLYMERSTEENCYLGGNPTEEEKATYKPLWDALDAQLARIDLVEPKEPQAAADTSFTTVDLDGNPVDSSVFSKAKITMVNIWGSFCSPCIAEMPELMALNEEMEDVQVITILGDSFSLDDDAAEDARDIVKQLGLNLPVYLANEEIAKIFPYQYFPTSYLVDQDGKPVGTSKIGGNTKEAYMAWIQEALDKK